MITTPAAAELFEWICLQLRQTPAGKQTGIYSPRVFAKVSQIELRKVRIDIKAAYSIHFDRCRYGYCGHVEEWITARTEHRAIWQRLVDGGAVKVDQGGIVRVV